MGSCDSVLCLKRFPRDFTWVFPLNVALYFTQQHLTGKYCTFKSITFRLTDLVTDYISDYNGPHPSRPVRPAYLQIWYFRIEFGLPLLCCKGRYFSLCYCALSYCTPFLTFLWSVIHFITYNSNAKTHCRRDETKTNRNPIEAV